MNDYAATLNGIRLDARRIAGFCARNRIERLSLFGSVLTDNFRPDSDMDFLVEFEKGCRPGLFALACMEAELSEMAGRKADLRTPEELSGYFREEVLAKAELIFMRWTGT